MTLERRVPELGYWSAHEHVTTDGVEPVGNDDQAESIDGSSHASGHKDTAVLEEDRELDKGKAKVVDGDRSVE